jgi:hypothetical protein
MTSVMGSIPVMARARAASERLEFEMAKNPWLSLWLGAANTWAGAARSFWSAELQRQQKTMLNEMRKPRGRLATKDSPKKPSAGGRKKFKERS